MPPADIRQGGQLHNQLFFQLVHVAVLRRVQRTGVYVSMGGGMDCEGQAERGRADNTLRFQPFIKSFPIVGFQQCFNLVADLRRVAQRGFLHSGKLRLIHIVHNAVYVGFQFGSVYHVQLVKLIEHHILALTYPAFRRQIVEPLLEVPLLGALHLEHLRQTAVLLPHVNFADFIVCGGKVNIVCLALEGKALCQHFLVQQFKRTVRKQRLLNFQEKLRDLQRFNILPELRIYLE